MTTPQSDIGIVEKLTFSHLTFMLKDKEVLRITSEGELIFADATEAAQAIKRAWDQMRSSAPQEPDDDALPPRKVIFDALISVGPVRPSPGSYMWKRAKEQTDAVLAVLQAKAPDRLQAKAPDRLGRAFD